MGADSGWEDVVHVPGSFLVNIGDLMARWTNDRWVSTMHHVVPPLSENGETADRMSIAFFLQSNDHAGIDCLPTCTDAEHPPLYERVTSGALPDEEQPLVDRQEGSAGGRPGIGVAGMSDASGGVLSIQPSPAFDVFDRPL